MMDVWRFPIHLLRVFAACVIFFHFCSLVVAAPVISSASQATLYLQKYGYVDKSVSDTASFVSQTAGQNAIKEFQRFSGLPETGRLDNNTLTMMNMPRCGVKDTVAQSGPGRRKRYILQGSKWPMTDLTYRISKYPQRLRRDRRDVDEEIAKAFKVWSDVTNLNFINTESGRVHIDVRFEEGDHGHGNGFDGPGGELAHAFFPQFGGAVHFDDEEKWTIKQHDGNNLLQVAAHEFGHSLGLYHSDVETAAMKPFYGEYEPSFSLDEDDILGIQALYGRREADAPMPNLCQDASIDAATITEDGKKYFFKGDYYLEVDGVDDTRIADGYPRKISEDWDGLPGKLDAALTFENGTTIFFKRNQYWSFRNKRMDNWYPKEISVGFPGIPNNIDAALFWSNGATYLFKGSQYWRYFTPSEQHTGLGYPQPISLWEGLPSNIDAAVKWPKQWGTYFFKGTGYYRFDSSKVVDYDSTGPYPRPSSVWWFNCPA